MAEKNSSSLTRGFVTGSAAVIEQYAFGSLLDMIKIEKQRLTSQSYSTIIRNFCGNGLGKGIILGLWPWGVLMYGTRGVLYGTGYHSSRIFLSNNDYTNGKFTTSQIQIFSGCFGGALEGAISAPFSMMRTRIAQSKALGITKKIPFDIRAALRSMPLNSVKRACDWGLRNYLYQNINPHFDPFLSGFLSGMISTTITTPIDRFLPVIQQKNPPKRVLYWFYQSIKQEGIKSVFAGNFARILHGGWHTCFIFGALHLFEMNKVMKF